MLVSISSFKPTTNMHHTSMESWTHTSMVYTTSIELLLWFNQWYQVDWKINFGCSFWCSIQTFSQWNQVHWNKYHLGQCLEADMRLEQMFWWSQFPKQMFWWYQVRTSETFSRCGCYIWPLANCTLLVMHLFGFSWSHPLVISSSLLFYTLILTTFSETNVLSFYALTYI